MGFTKSFSKGIKKVGKVVKKAVKVVKKNAGTIGAVGGFALGGPAGAALGQSLGDVGSGRGFSLKNTALAGGAGLGINSALGPIAGYGSQAGGAFGRYSLGSLGNLGGVSSLSNLLGGGGYTDADLANGLPGNAGSSAGGNVDWGSLLGQLGTGALGGIGATNAYDKYGDVIREGMTWGKGELGRQEGYANEIPGQINQYMPQTQGDVAYEQGTERSPYFAQGNAYGTQLADILSGKADWKTDPGYAFRMQQGQQETERNAASRGYNQSGNIMAALQDRAQNTASAEYGNITDRLAKLQDQYGNQDINATNIMSGDRRNNTSNATNFITNMMNNQAGYRNNVGQLGGGILDMYNNKAGAAGGEAQAPWQYGASAFGGASSDPTVGGIQGIANGVSGASNIWNAGRSLYNSIFG